MVVFELSDGLGDDGRFRRLRRNLRGMRMEFGGAVCEKFIFFWEGIKAESVAGDFE